MQTVTPYLYWRWSFKGILKKCAPVYVCMDCLGRTMISSGLVWHPSGRSLAQSIQEALLQTYNILVAEDSVLKSWRRQ
jgi:hypothetical protein